MKILVLNAGSSSQKSRLYEVVGDAPPTAEPAPLWKAQTEGAAASPSAIGEPLQTLWKGPTAALQHLDGGGDFRQPVRITMEVKSAVSRWARLARDRNPAALAGIEAVEKLMGAVPQVALFDTVFHTSLPRI